MLPKAHIDKYMMNPLTRRSIVIKGRVWKSLVKDGIINPENNETIVHDVPEEPSQKPEPVFPERIFRNYGENTNKK